MKTNRKMSMAMKSSELKRLNVKSRFLKSAVVKGAIIKSAMVKIPMVLAAVVVMTSCGKTEKPEIVSFELGYENSKSANAGDELHMDAEVVAEGTIDMIRIVIHPEGGHAKKGVRSVSDEGKWEVDTTYTKFSGLKNTTFHEHLDVPVDAEPGDYHFHFEVVDMEGYQTVFEEELEIKLPDEADVSLPF
jgi:hypothetical protein